MTTIDWAPFDGTPEGDCTCDCVFADLKDGDEIPTFRSHVKISDGRLVTRKSCPRCGSCADVHSFRGDSERF